MKMIPVASPDIGPLEERYALEAIRSGWVSSLGEFVSRFEEAFAHFCGVPHAVAVSNGTDALLLALKACGVAPGDEVIIPNLTFAAVPAAVVHVGATPVLADIHPEYWCIDPTAVAAAITSKTRAIIAVHLYGHPADMDALLELAKPRHVRVIEDCAEAHGAKYKGRCVGSIGDVAAFSFYGNKILTTGEGGAVTTHDPDIAARVRFLKDHAMDPAQRYWHTEAGYNCRMTNVQAALGCAQLERIAELTALRRQALSHYLDACGHDDSLVFNPKMPWADPVVWLVSARLRRDLADRRDGVLSRLRGERVDTRPFFIPMSQLPPYAGCRTVRGESASTVAEDVARAGFNLPSGYGLSVDDLRYAATRLRQSVRPE